MSHPNADKNPKVEKIGGIALYLGMSMTLQQIMMEARQLPREQVSELMDQLLADAFAQPDPAVETAWREETCRRAAEIQNGKVEGIPGEQVMAEVRKIAGL